MLAALEKQELPCRVLSGSLVKSQKAFSISPVSLTLTSLLLIYIACQDVNTCYIFTKNSNEVMHPSIPFHVTSKSTHFSLYMVNYAHQGNIVMKREIHQQIISPRLPFSHCRSYSLRLLSHY